MKQTLLFTFLLLNLYFLKAQSLVSGRILNEERQALSNVQVLNMRNQTSAYSNAEGQFSIAALVGDELRVVAKQYNRYNLIVSKTNLEQEIIIQLSPAVREIAGVNIISKSQIENMKNNIGVPAPPEKPREKVPTLKNTVAIPVIPIAVAVNLNNLYKIISGDARRMKALYKYEDQQEYLGNMVNLLGDDFWEQSKIAKEKHAEFIQYLLGKKVISGKPSKEQLEFTALSYVDEFLNQTKNP